MITATFTEVGGFLTLERGWTKVFRKEFEGSDVVGDLYVGDRSGERDTRGVPLGCRLAPVGAVMDFGGAS